MDELVAMPERYGKPLLISSFFGREDNCIQTFHTKGIPTFDAPEKAARAMSAFYKYLLFRNRPLERPSLNDTVPDEALRLMQQSGETGIDEFLAKGILRAYGVPTAKEALAYNLDEVKANAEEIGYPVVLKVCSSKITHKTEFGMVQAQSEKRA